MFSICCMALPTQEMMQFFIAKNSNLYVEEIVILIDEDRQPKYSYLDELQSDYIKVYYLGQSSWSKHFSTERPWDFRTRRNYIFQNINKFTSSQWTAILDDDELFFIKCIDKLAALMSDDKILAITIPNYEAVSVLTENDVGFCGHKLFRRPINRKIDLFYIYLSKAFLITNGVVGYSGGKQIIRTDAEFDVITSHKAIIDGKLLNVVLSHDELACAVLHYDAPDFSHWMRKFIMRKTDRSLASIGNKKRKRLQRFFNIFQNDRVLYFYYNLLYKISEREKNLLSSRNKIIQIEIE